jgi:hypothetical protein
VDAQKLETMEAEAKLQLRVARAVLKQRLEMCGNVLLVAWLLAMGMLAIWVALCPLVHAYSLSGSWLSPLLRIEPGFLARVNTLGMAGWKLASFLLFLMPGLALKICAGAMGKA